MCLPMPDQDHHRARAEALLKLAAGADNMRERGRLIDEAMRLQGLADAEEGGDAWDAAAFEGVFIEAHARG